MPAEGFFAENGPTDTVIFLKRGKPCLKLHKWHRRVILIIVSCVVVLTASLIGGFSAYYSAQLKPVDTSNEHAVTVTVDPGNSLQTIGRQLEKKGLVRKAWAFQFYARWNHLNHYRAGTYLFNRTMSAKTIMDSLAKGEHRQQILLIDVREGMWISEIADRMAKISGMTKNDILVRLSNHRYVEKHYMSRYPFLTKEILAKGIKYPLEGYLSPGLYRFNKGKKPIGLDEMIDPMLRRTDQMMKRYEAEIDDNSLGSVHKVLTMASLVEQEAPGREDREKIAGVFYNRLNKKMRLQTDPSVAYGLQRRVRDYTKKDLKNDTPFNTYTRKGLTVGPIGSPAPDAVRAVLRPIRTDNLYFYARPNGKVYYSKTYDQHQAIVAKYRREWADRS